MNLDELYEILEKYDSPELWASPGSGNESVAGQRKVVVAALAQLEKLILAKGDQS